MANVGYTWIKVVPPFIVNHLNDAGDQIQPAIAASTTGEYFTAWSDPGASYDIMGRMNPSNTQGTFLNSTTANDQSDASLAGLLDGRFVASFTDTSTDPGGDIRLRMFNADGSPAGDDFLVDPALSWRDDRESDVARLADGGFAVTWTRSYGGGNNDIRAAVYNADGSVRTPLAVVNSDPASNTRCSSVAGLADGGFVVAWEQLPAVGGDIELRFRRFDAAGNPLDGSDSIGVLIASSSINRDVQVAALPDGGFVVAYTDNGWNGLDTDITARVFNADGSARSDRLWVNAITNHGFTPGDQNQPTLAVLPNGDFVVGWSSGDAFSLQAYDSDGHTIGRNDGNPLATSLVVEGEIAGLGDHRLALLWQSPETDGSGGSMRSAVFDLGRQFSGIDTDETIVGIDDGMRESFNGGGGNDTLIGGEGPDYLFGNAGTDTAVFAGDRSSFLVNLLANGEVEVIDQRPGQPLGTDTMCDVERLVFDDGVFAPVAPLGDVVWRHDEGSVATASGHLGVVSTNFRIRGTGDFDGDGDADILWQHFQGQVVTWEMEDGVLAATHSLPQVSTSFRIAGTGDFDEDGDADILWSGSEGQVVTWEMEDGQLVTNHNFPQVSTSFRVARTGDFDGDGDADILWRGNEGQVVTWEMENGGLVTNHNLPQVSTGFWIAGTGDFDGDGDADILWRGNEGQVVTWEMENGGLVTNHNLPQIPTSYWIAGTQDFDSDGDADILWRGLDGLVVTWEMDDGNLVTNHNHGVVESAWQIRGTGEFDLA